jgi:hypothetical protein
MSSRTFLIPNTVGLGFSPLALLPPIPRQPRFATRPARNPIAMCVRAMMVDRILWTGSASDLLRLYAESAREDISTGPAWAKNPRALAGRLRRAQTFLRTLGIEITFSREGRPGTRMIRVSMWAKNTVSTVSIVGSASTNGSGRDPPGLTGVLE